MLLLVLCAPAAGAQEAEQTPPSLVAEPVEVIGTRDVQDPRSPTSATTLVELGGRPAVDLDLSGPLAAVPSLVVRRYGGPGSLLTASLRGSAADQVVVRLGPVPLTPPGGGGVDLSLVPPALLSSVRIVRGTEAAVHGAGALGGVVLLDPLRGPGSALDLELTGGSFSTLAGAVTGRTEVAGVRVAGGVAGHGTGGAFGFERDLTPNLPDDPWVDAVRRGNGARQGTALVGAELPLDAGTFALTTLGHLSQREIPGPVGFPTPGARSRSARFLAGAGFQGRPAGGLALSPAARAWVDVDRFEYHPGPEPSVSAGLPEDGARTVLGVEAEVRAALGVHVPRLIVQGTWEALSVRAADAGRRSLSLIAADTAWLFSEALVVHGALRLDAFTGAPLFLSPKLGAAWTPQPGLRLSANAGQGVRLPTLPERFAESALLAPNPELRPERALTFDASVEVVLGMARLELGAWHSAYQDLISYELYPPLRLKPVNFRGASVDGATLEAQLTPAPFLEVLASVTATQAVNRRPDPNEAGNLLPYRPPLRGLLRAQTHLGRVTAFAELEGQSAYPRNRAGTKEIPGRLLVGAGARLELGALSLVASATNLLDDRRLEDVYGYPLPGRALLVTARLSLPSKEPRP